jgi:hypothetical protein
MRRAAAGRSRINTGTSTLMAKGEQRGNREKKKPKKEKPKVIAAAASTKSGWQPKDASISKKK